MGLKKRLILVIITLIILSVSVYAQRTEVIVDGYSKIKSGLSTGEVRTFGYYTNIPEDVTKVKIGITPLTSCITYGKIISPCQSSASMTTTYTEYCSVSVTPGQRLEFDVEVDYTRCYSGREGKVSVVVKRDTQPSAYCGDGNCDSGETCSSCPGDCGACQPTTYCGDHFCNGGETCYSCPGDCGTCPVTPSTYCGDGNCDSDETCSSCPGDCGSCPTSAYCGDGKCDSSESCSSCPGDCGTCLVTKKADGKSCSSGSECTSGRCQSGICCPSGKTCCKFNSDCGSGKVCSDYYCTEPPAYDCGDGFCGSNEDCRICETDCRCESSKCCSPYSGENPDSHGCVASGSYTLKPSGFFTPDICCNGKSTSGDCCQDSDCKSEEICHENSCIREEELKQQLAPRENGERCKSNNQCVSGYCGKVDEYRSVCCESGRSCCLFDDDCPSGETCSSERSNCFGAWEKPEGDSCKRNEECEGYCSKSPGFPGYCCSSGKTCCFADDHCPKEHKCDTSNPIGLNKIYHCIPKTLEEIKSADGKSCKTSSDCYLSSSWCNKGVCCPHGKSCCKDDYNCPGNYGTYQCNEQFYCIKVKKEEKVEGGRCCFLNPDDKFDGKLDKDNCVPHGEAGKVTQSDGKTYDIICCNGERPKQYIGFPDLECCDNSDCDEGEVCIESHLCKKARVDANVNLKVLKDPGALYGIGITGMSQSSIEYHKKQGSLKRLIFGVGVQGSAAYSWYDVSRYEFLKGQERLNNARRMGYFKSLYTALDKLYVAASLRESLQALKTDLDKLLSIGSASKLVENIDTLVSFSGNLKEIYGQVYELTSSEAPKVGIQKEDSAVMDIIGGLTWGAGLVASGGWTLLADVAHGITSNTGISINYEMQMASLNLALAYHAERMAKLTSFEAENKYGYIYAEAREEGMTLEEAQEFFYHAERFLMLKKLELLLKYRDDVATYIENPDALVWGFSLIGWTDPEAIIKEKKEEMDDSFKDYDDGLKNLKMIKKLNKVE